MKKPLTASQTHDLSDIIGLDSDSFRNMPVMPQSAIVWSTVFTGIELPLQAIRHCYRIENVMEEEVARLAWLMPSSPDIGLQDWEYFPETNTVFTKNKLLAACFKNRGKKIGISRFVVGLVYSEVMEMLGKQSVKAVTDILELLKRGACFRFSRCALDDGMKAVAKSLEKGLIRAKNDWLFCRDFRIALELVNITGHAPILVLQDQALPTE